MGFKLSNLLQNIFRREFAIDALILFLTIAGMANGVSYLLTNNQIKFFQLISFSPVPTVFINPSFFRLKHFRFETDQGTIIYDINEKNAFLFKSGGRHFYFLLLSPHLITEEDWNRSVQFLYCDNRKLFPKGDLIRFSIEHVEGTEVKTERDYRCQKKY